MSDPAPPPQSSWDDEMEKIEQAGENLPGPRPLMREMAVAVQDLEVREASPPPVPSGRLGKHIQPIKIKDPVPLPDPPNASDSVPTMAQAVAAAESDTPHKEDPPYPESFASAHETALLREELEGIRARLQENDETVKSLMAERKAIPEHMNQLKAEMNNNFTIMLEKLHASLERDRPQGAIESAVSAVEAMKTETAETLKVAASHASEPPSSTNPLSSASSKLRGRKKFKAVF
jgi:hypothetical protein